MRQVNFDFLMACQRHAVEQIGDFLPNADYTDLLVMIVAEIWYAESDFACLALKDTTLYDLLFHRPDWKGSAYIVRIPYKGTITVITLEKLRGF